jgi:hypothetical protein
VLWDGEVKKARAYYLGREKRRLDLRHYSTVAATTVAITTVATTMITAMDTTTISSLTLRYYRHYVVIKS